MAKEYQKCPVCEGRQMVPVGFYLADGYNTGGVGMTQNCCIPVRLEGCRTCKSTGVIVRPDEIQGIK